MGHTRQDKGNSLVMQGSILVIASIIVRLIGFFYRIPLYRMIGDTGMGYYSAAFGVYSIILMISSYGIPIAVSKLVAARLSLREYKNAHQIFIGALIFALIVGGLGSAVLWFGAEFFALIYDESMLLAFYALRALSPTILIVAILGVFRGYFQGMNTMVPTALSQIIEQIINAIVSIVAAYMLVSMGSHFGAMGGTIGTGAGAFLGLLFMIVVYLFVRPMIHRRMARDTHTHQLSQPELQRIIIMTIVPIVIGSAVFHITSIIDDIMFTRGLGFHGYENVSGYLGILNGKYKTIITLPVSLGSAIAAATVPSITTSLKLGQMKEVNRKIDVAIRFLMLLAIPAMVGIIVLAKPILLLLFDNFETNQARLLQFGSISVIFFCLSTLGIGILQGLDRISLPVKHSAIALLVKVIFNILLLFVFDTNLFGAVTTNIIFAFISSFLNLRSVKQMTQFKLDITKTFIKPTLVALGMGTVAFIWYQLAYALLRSNGISTITAILLAIVVYGLGVIKFKIITEEELKNMPKGTLLIKLGYKLRLFN